MKAITRNARQCNGATNMGSPRIATGAPQFAHVRAERV